MFRTEMRPPGFPFVPFVFPMAFAMSLLGLMAYLQYRTLREIRGMADQRGGQSGYPSATRPHDTGFSKVSSY